MDMASAALAWILPQAADQHRDDGDGEFHEMQPALRASCCHAA